MKSLLFVLCIIAGFISCEGDKQSESIPFTISEDSLVMIMIDLQIADQAIKVADPKSRDSMRHLYASQLLEIYGIDSLKLATNLNLLKNDKKIFEEIQTRVVDSLKVLDRSI
jgi:hypothetical protein